MYMPWMKQEQLERCFDRILKQLAKESNVTFPQEPDQEILSDLCEKFSKLIEITQNHIAQVVECRQELIVRSCDVVHAAKVLGIKLYGYDECDTSRLAVFDTINDPTISTVDTLKNEMDHNDLIYTAPKEDFESESSDSDVSIDEISDTESYGDGDFSECERTTRNALKGDDDFYIYSTDNPYWIPRRSILRLFRDSSHAISMELKPISRKGLSAFHNLIETQLTPLIVTTFQFLMARPIPCVNESNITPTLNRRSKKRLSGDVFQPMANASQKRKSPRLAKKKMSIHLDFHEMDRSRQSTSPRKLM